MKSEMDLRHTGFLGLIGSLRDDFTDMIKREVALLKAELSEKFSGIGKQGALLAAGGMIAYTGVIFLLIGLCFLLTLGLQSLGLSLGMAAWTSFAAFGLLVALGGYLLVKGALRKLSQSSLAPRETIATLKEIRNPENMNLVPAAAKTNGLSKTQTAKIEAERKIEEVQAEAEAIRERLKPKNLMRSGSEAVRNHPMRSAAIAGATVGLGMFMRRRRQRRIQIAL